MLIIEDIYIWLAQVNLVTTQYEFSEKWLGQTKSYFSSLRCTGNGAGIKALVCLRIKLQRLLERQNANERQIQKIGIAFDVRPKLKMHIDALDRLIEQRCLPSAYLR